MTLLHRPVPGLTTSPLVGPGRGSAGHALDVVGLAVRVSRGAVLSTVLAALVLPSVLLTHQGWLLAAGFLLGLPHGAVDHLLPVRHGWVRRGPLGMSAVLIAYVAVAALTYLGLRLAGSVVLPVLLAVSVLHFGAGDLASTPSRPEPGSRLRRWAAALGRGAAVVAGPLLCWPVPTGAALAAVGLGTAPSRTSATVVAVVLLGSTLAYALSALRRGRPADAAEVALLVALFTLAPPLAAFGVYFGAWHGLRHTARLLADDPSGVVDLGAGRLGRPLLRFLGAAAAPTLVALAAVSLLVGLAAGHADLAAPVFAALLALTVPHVVVVGLWDLTERHVRRSPGTRGRPEGAS